MFTKAFYKGAALVALAASASFGSTAFAENTDRSRAEPACRSSDVILCEDWEDGDWVGWSDYNVGDSLNKGGFRGGDTCATGGCTLPYPGYNNSRAVAIVLPENAPDGIYPRGRFNERVGINDTIYARWRAYWSPGFHFNYTNTKHAYLVTNATGGSLTNRIGFWVRPAGGSGSDPTVGVPYFHVYANQVEVASGSWQDKGNDIRYYPNQPGTEDFRIVGGKWYEIEIRVTPNPLGQRFGGRLQFWIDGKLMADYSDNVSVRKANDNNPYDGFWFSSYFGGGGQTNHPRQYVVVDDLIVSKSRIGGKAVVNAPPSAPVLRAID